MARQPSFTGELLHFHAVRLRVTGSGNLKQSFHSLDDIHSANLVDLALSATTNREPTVLANFIDQRGQLKLTTTEIDETVTVSKIIIFIKPVASGYPQ